MRYATMIEIKKQTKSIIMCLKQCESICICWLFLYRCSYLYIRIQHSIILFPTFFLCYFPKQQYSEVEKRPCLLRYSSTSAYVVLVKEKQLVRLIKEDGASCHLLSIQSTLSSSPTEQYPVINFLNFFHRISVQLSLVLSIFRSL